jgi:hypothetical protein
MDVQFDKPKIIDLSRAEFGFIIRTVGLLSPDELAEPCAPGKWSVKDTLAHLTAWHARLLGWLEQHRRGQTPVLPEPGFSWDDRDALNERTFAANRNRGLQTVLREFKESHARVLHLVDSLSERELTDTKRFEWAGGPLGLLVAHNTYLHYFHHITKVREWMLRSGAGRRA